MKHVSPWNYPTTTIVLDDSCSFLESVKLIIPHKNRRLIFMTNPSEVIDLIKKSHDKMERSLSLLRNDQVFELSRIPLIAKCKLRSHEISTLIVDYHMPSMNGLEVCKELKNTVCQKILLTANSEETVAIKAFNNKMIDGYMRKQDPNIDIILPEAIKSAETNYLSKKFDSIVSSTERNNLVFSDPNIQSFLRGHLKEYKVPEHYMTDANGSIICIGDDGFINHLLIKNRDEVRIPLTWQASEKFSERDADDIFNCKKMLCASIDELINFNADSWGEITNEANPLPNKPGYFAALSSKLIYDFEPTDISAIFVDEN